MARKQTFGPQADLDAARNFIEMWEGSLEMAKEGHPSAWYSVAECEEALADARLREQTALQQLAVVK
ncbi:MAG: hypothetical protein F4X64_18595 [Chloroflexi bacterium]|nr:hypothetical protein [Chloroflexota bacterium]